MQRGWSLFRTLNACTASSAAPSMIVTPMRLAAHGDGRTRAWSNAWRPTGSNRPPRCSRPRLESKPGRRGSPRSGARDARRQFERRRPTNNRARLLIAQRGPILGHRRGLVPATSSLFFCGPALGLSRRWGDRGFVIVLSGDRESRRSGSAQRRLPLHHDGAHRRDRDPAVLWRAAGQHRRLLLREHARPVADAVLGLCPQDIIPSTLGSHSDSPGQYVTITRKASSPTSHGITATVSSVMPIFAMPEAT